MTCTTLITYVRYIVCLFHQLFLYLPMSIQCQVPITYVLYAHSPYILSSFIGLSFLFLSLFSFWSHAQKSCKPITYYFHCKQNHFPTFLHYLILSYHKHTFYPNPIFFSSRCISISTVTCIIIVFISSFYSLDSMKWNKMLDYS